MREAQHQAKFAAEMAPSRQLHKEGHLAKDALAVAMLLEQLEQPAAEKAKEAEESTCRGCTGKYTDARGSGGGSKKNQGLCRARRAGMRSRGRASTGAGRGRARTAAPANASTRALEEQLQGLRGCEEGDVRARAPEECVQGLRHRPMPARALEEQLQGLRHEQIANRQIANRPGWGRRLRACPC
jgi:hypothetical protein